ncbi:Slx4p interacting protein [Taxawa tesnikishii (nom. ined.)]|nr:Slx4p interacting protein [Dothideales sp. JES 119]
MTLVCSAEGWAENHGDAIVPTSGRCPDCKETLLWSDLVRDLSLRIRGEKEVAKLFKIRKPRSKKGEKNSQAVAIEDEESGDDDEDEELNEAIIVGADNSEFRYLESDDDTLSEPDDAWLDIDDLPLDFSVRKTLGKLPNLPKKKVPLRREEVVEDSDWDDAEILD